MTVLAKVCAGDYEVSLEGASGDFRAALRSRREADGLDYVVIRLEADAPFRPAPLRLVWEHPLAGSHARWFPGCDSARTILPEWRARRRCVSRNTLNAPVYSLFDSCGRNRLTFALSDALNTVALAAGVVEETAAIRCEVGLFTEPGAPVESYEATLRLDSRPVPYHEALRDVSDWWAAMPEAAPSPVPEHARLPMYSSWYSFHQRLSPEGLERQCLLAKGLGMESVIVDDGWQTDDNSRGYSYCGDWEVTATKFPDFAAHVERVRKIGMKYMLWFSVPFVGVKSKAYARFRDKVLDPAAREGWFVLDPRFPEVREYLVGLYEDFATRYGIDGFKLDFVDTFELSPETRDTSGGGRDIDSVPEAVDALLTDAMRRLRAINGEILVEFRQSYIGPLMRKYGNMFRAGDVPGDFHGNRTSTVDIRLISGSTPAHSDMVMWSPRDSVEGAAMQLVHALFSVPQVSMLLDRIGERHQAMLRRYLSFWREHRDVLLDGELAPLGPEFLYPAVIAANDTTLLAACYGGGLVPISQSVPKNLVIVNGTFGDRVILDVAADAGDRTLEVVSCTGELVKSKKVRLGAGLHSIDVPPAGTAVLEG